MSQSLAKKTAAAFVEKFGYEPTGVWSAPGRVNLIGEHTDYNEGFVFPLAINRRTYTAFGKRSDGVFRVATSFSDQTHQVLLSEISAGQNYDWAAYPFGMAWAVIQKAKAAGLEVDLSAGFDCFIDSDVPVGAGLSSSAAIECAVGVAINELWNLNLDDRTLAQAGQLGENQIVGAPTGIMDQSASMLGQLDHAVFLDCRTLETQAIELGFAAAGLELLIIDTRVAHRLVDGGYAERRAACERGAELLGASSLRDVSEADLTRAREIMDDVTFRRVRHVVTENQRVLDTIKTLREKGPAAIGPLMYQSHQSMRDDFEISIDELDTAVETALAHGAIGARMTGGGFGGAAIALTPIEKISEVTLAVLAEFENLGYATPNIFSVSAADGAAREQLI